MVRGVRALGLETCVTAGMVSARQARQLKAAGLDYYNHNLDTSEAFYGKIISTRNYQDPFDFVRTIAVARIMMPRAQVRLSAGRETMSDELQALAFVAGANSIFYGEKLLVTGNPDVEHDRALLARLGMHKEAPGAEHAAAAPLAANA